MNSDSQGTAAAKNGFPSFGDCALWYMSLIYMRSYLIISIIPILRSLRHIFNNKLV